MSYDTQIEAAFNNNPVLKEIERFTGSENHKDYFKVYETSNMKVGLKVTMGEHFGKPVCFFRVRVVRPDNSDNISPIKIIMGTMFDDIEAHFKPLVNGVVVNSNDKRVSFFKQSDPMDHLLPMLASDFKSFLTGYQQVFKIMERHASKIISELSSSNPEAITTTQNVFQQIMDMATPTNPNPEKQVTESTPDNVVAGDFENKNDKTF